MERTAAGDSFALREERGDNFVFARAGRVEGGRRPDAADGCCRFGRKDVVRVLLDRGRRSEDDEKGAGGRVFFATLGPCRLLNELKLFQCC